MTEELMQRMLAWRGVEDPCPKCGGSGVRVYGSTALWRGGMGGAMCTKGVCDACWGSGDAHRPRSDIRALEAECEAWDEDQCLNYLGLRLGLPFDHLRLRISQLADICDKQSKRRKVPDGESEFWWSHSWHALGSILRKLSTGGTGG